MKESNFSVNFYHVDEYNDKRITSPVIKWNRFTGGEWNVKLSKFDVDDVRVVVVSADIYNGDIMQLAILVDAVRELVSWNRDVKYDLRLNYLPYARQDRAMTNGESFSLRVFSDMLNSLKFDKVYIEDCHSDVGLALVKNVVNHPQYPWSIVSPEDYDAVVSPDGGALKKVYGVVQSVLYRKELPVIQASKYRDVKTGDITATRVFDDVTGKKLLIVDDIADGGYTFVKLAEVLKEKGAKQVDLYVTHGIFSKGKKLENVDNVYCKIDWTLN